MKTYKLIIVSAVSLWQAAFAADSNFTVLPEIRKSVFEIVMLKPEKDSLTYTEPLPFDLLPFAERNDKYFAIGSGFAINGNEMVTAWHVLNLGAGGLNQRFFARDLDGKVYEVDQITGFSNQRDYVVLTLKGKKFDHWLKPAVNKQINEKVFAIGNALGQGIIARDGIFTSETPEAISGQWKWIRFSAAVSPGNSGGPLVNEQGALLGVVLRKSENENLNYALPTEQFFTNKHENAIEFQMYFRFYNTILRHRSKYYKKYDVPANYLELDKKLEVDHLARSESMLKEFMEQKKSEYFPNGPGAEKILSSTYDPVFPMLIAQSNDGVWALYEPEKKEKIEMEKGGIILYGSMRGLFFQFMKIPQGEKIRKYITDPKHHIDQMLKYMLFARDVAGHKIRIKSFGAPKGVKQHSDKYGRKWVVSEFDIEYANEKLLIYSLPTPEGILSIMVRDHAGAVVNDLAPDLRKITDYIVFSYYGQFAEWSEFLKLKEFLPPQFNSIKFDYKAKSHVSLQVPEYSLRIDGKKFTLDDESDLRLDFAFVLNKNEVNWRFGDMQLGENKNTNTVLQIYRMAKPSDSLPEGYRLTWEKIMSEKAPYDSSVKVAENKTTITKTLKKLQGKKDGKVTHQYSIRYIHEGTIAEKEIKQKLLYLESTITPVPPVSK